MKETLSTHQIVDRLFADKDAGWTWEGAKALADYLEQLEQDTGTEMEFDAVAFRCEYSEYGSLLEWAQQHFGDPDYKEEFGFDEDTEEDDMDDPIRDYLNDHTTLIEFNGGIIIADF